MPRTNYQRGADKERRILNAFRKKGCIALRSAGSHSIIDVVVIDPYTFNIKLIQAKTSTRGTHETKLSEKARQKIIDFGSKLDGLYHVRFELWD